MANHSLASALRRSLELRADALAGHVDDLLGRVPDTEFSLKAALALFAFYPETLKVALAKELERATDDEAQLQLLRIHAAHTAAVATFLEHWLTSALSMNQQIALHRAVERECDALGIGPRLPILSPGHANNWETFPGDLEMAVLEHTMPPLGLPVPDGLTGRKYALLRVPRYEGRQALWRPVVLGHEIAHLAIEAHGSLAALEMKRSFDWSGAKELFDSEDDSTVSRSVLSLFETAKNWAIELLCDAHATRRFGPAGASSLSEFLSTISLPGAVSATHPPPWLRFRLMSYWLGDEIPEELAPIRGAWESLSHGAPPSFDTLPRFVTDYLWSIRDEFIAAISPWSDAYPFVERGPIIQHLSDEVAQKRPPSSVFIDAHGDSDIVDDQDLVNAGWLAYNLENSPTLQLVEKAIENSEFLRQWRAAGGDVAADVHVPDKEEEVVDVGATGLLGRNEILAALGRDHNPLAIVPRLPGAVGAASIDVRLGNEFIVFQRTQTSAFDPLSIGDDPRAMQRRVSRSWGERFILHPGELVLAALLEYLVLPPDLAAQVVTRSSYGRLGLLTATAIQVHPRFHGCLTLELVNLGQLPIELTPGERIAQLILFRTEPSAEVAGKYNYPVGPQFSMVRRDAEANVLRAMQEARESDGRGS